MDVVAHTHSSDRGGSKGLAHSAGQHNKLVKANHERQCVLRSRRVSSLRFGSCTGSEGNGIKFGDEAGIATEIGRESSLSVLIMAVR